MKTLSFLATVVLLGSQAANAAAPTLDEKPASAEEWGYRPVHQGEIEVSPPGFSWRPQSGIETWELECRRGSASGEVVYRGDGIDMNVHCPAEVFSPGAYAWRYRGVATNGEKTNWSKQRTFEISEDAVSLPMPPRDELLTRIPQSHPRLFVRPEDLPRLQKLARGSLLAQFEDLVARCEKLVANPPPTDEPKTYPSTMRSGSQEWKTLWWGNRTYTIAALDGAATLAFTRLLGGKEEYGQLAKRILMDCAQWDPTGATGYRYNDEAGMPYAYHFSRTYTFVNDLLSEEEKAQCREVMKVRGEEMYQHLFPRHLWRPYSSHSNRAWHFLGEVGIAFSGEVEGAEDWVWFAMNVFYNVYPVWSDDDGGWHEGVMYWSSYVGRFTWWADVMRSAMGVNAYDKPYFAKAGYYPIYLMPPGKLGGGFGDGATRRKASHNVPLVSQLAAQSGNPHWQWYVEAMDGPTPTSGYVGFLRGALPRVEGKPPVDQPVSRHFRGTGQAVLNTTLKDARENVQIVFKSSPMGTRSHGNAANNSFVLSAYGQRLLTRTGHYYMYGGPHHRDWVWSTRSLNNITVNGKGQVKRSAATKGEITFFKTTPYVDVVVGEAAEGYYEDESTKKPRVLDRYTRTIVFAKPDLMVVYDQLQARNSSTYEYWLHSPEEFGLKDQRSICVQVEDVVCEVDILHPPALSLKQTNEYDPNPWPQIKTREWHLTAVTPGRTEGCEFVTVYRIHRSETKVPAAAKLDRKKGEFELHAEVADGRIVVRLPIADDKKLSVRRFDRKGKLIGSVASD